MRSLITPIVSFVLGFVVFAMGYWLGERAGHGRLLQGAEAYDTGRCSGLSDGRLGILEEELTRVVAERERCELRHDAGTDR